MKVNQFSDGETKRQQRNLTTSQKIANSYTKEGVIINNFAKGGNYDNSSNLKESYDSLIISDETKLPKQLKENYSAEKNLVPISAVALSVMSIIALLTGFIRHSTKVNLDKNLSALKRLPTITRNVTLNEETHQALYQIIQSPNQKTILAGVGVLTLTALAFMGKTFFDGFKDVWIKKKEASIQKNLQESLIDVETQSFAGKIQITRNMLSEKAKEFEKYLGEDKVLPNFGKNFKNISFSSSNKNETTNKNPFIYFLMGAGTVASIIGLGFLAMKNLSKCKQHLDTGLKNTEEAIVNIVKTSTNESKKNDKSVLSKMFIAIEANTEKIREGIKSLNWSSEEKEQFIADVSKKIETSTTKVDNAIGGNGTPKPAFVSFVNDYRAFFYNWLLDTSNPQFKALFFGITGVTAAGYGGKLAGDAIKEVQVKKYNAQTELNLQQNLVSTELRNFKSKKDAAIKPLTDEFYKKANEGKPKEELKMMADNILQEIKNGPPFVYS